MKNKRTTKPLEWSEAKRCLELLEHEKNYNDLLLLAVGFHTGYRIGDIIELKYSDFDNSTLDIQERKTTKQRAVPITAELRRIVELCKKELKRKDEHYLFTRIRYNSNTPITTHSAIARIKKALTYCKVKGNNLTAHTLRKTFALHYYNLAKNTEGDYRALNELSKMLNHASTDTTRLYIGISEQIKENIFAKF